MFLVLANRSATKWVASDIDDTIEAPNCDKILRTIEESISDDSFTQLSVSSQFAQRVKFNGITDSLYYFPRQNSMQTIRTSMQGMF